MKDIQSYSIFLISYFTICSGIYHVTFWDTFDINGLSYLGIEEIFKSFIYPFVASVILIVVQFILIAFFTTYNNIYKTGEGRNSDVGKILNSKIVINVILILWLAQIFLFYRRAEGIIWIIFGLYFAFTLSIIISRIAEFNNYNAKYINLKIKILVFLPIFSFVSGKYQSEMIYKNTKYKYTINQNKTEKTKSNRIDTLKLIGNSDNQYFFTDLKNINTYIIKKDIIDTLILKNKNNYK